MMKKSPLLSGLAGIAIFTLIGCGTPASNPQGNKPVAKPNISKNHAITSPVRGTSISSLALSALNMINLATGWAVAKNGAVWFTTDGARTWQNITPKGFHLSSYLQRYLYSIDATQAWYAVASYNQKFITVYRTTNRGQTWNAMKINVSDNIPSILNLQFSDRYHGWLSISLGAAAGSEQESIYQTDNGGISWRKMADTNNSEDGTLPFGGDKSGVGFINPAQGWATGYIPKNGFVYLYQTRNDGQTWSQQKVPIPSKFQGGQFSTFPPVFFGKQDGVFPVFSMSNHSTSQELLMYRTNNGGNSWVPTTPVNLAPETKWSFVSANNWFVNGNNLLVTYNGGQTWKTIKANIPLDNISELDFTSPTDGWILKSTGALYHTVDGGLVWEKIK